MGFDPDKTLVLKHASNELENTLEDAAGLNAAWLEFSHADVRRFRFYAGLLEALVNTEEELLGRYQWRGIR